MEIAVCGTKVYYELSGAGEKKILLLHGWGCETKLMRPVAEQLTGAQTLVIDFPGHVFSFVAGNNLRCQVNLV